MTQSSVPRGKWVCPTYHGNKHKQTKVAPNFSVEQRVAQGCSLSPILFSIFISDLLNEFDRAEVGIHLKSGNKVGGILFTDDFVSIMELSENLQQLINIL